MKAITKMGAGINACTLYFAYEDWQGNWGFNNYDDAHKQLGAEVYLTGFVHNHYYNCTERVDSIQVPRKPTIKMIKQFINNCKQILQ